MTAIAMRHEHKLYGFAHTAFANRWRSLSTMKTFRAIELNLVAFAREMAEEPWDVRAQFFINAQCRPRNLIEGATSIATILNPRLQSDCELKFFLPTLPPGAAGYWVVQMKFIMLYLPFSFAVRSRHWTSCIADEYFSAIVSL